MKWLFAWLGLLLSGAVMGAAVALVQGAPPAELPFAPGQAAASMRGDASAEAAKAPEVAPLRVLFLGNSYSFENHMPHLIDGLAQAAGQAPLSATLDCPGGFTLAQHAAAGRYREHLSATRHDFVVLQEQSQGPSFSDRQRARDMEPAVRTLVTAARAAGARPLLFTTWARQAGDPENRPGDDYEAMQARVIHAYQELGSALSVARVPVGDAWQAVHRERPELALWKPDGSHPTLLGSYLAACTFYSLLYDRPVAGNRFHAGLPADQARLIQERVDRVIADMDLVEPPSADDPIVARQGEACPAGYEPLEDVCFLQSLGADESEQLRMLIEYKAGLRPTLRPR